MTAPLKVFISYAHEDSPWVEKLKSHLSLMERQGILKVWHDRCLTAGEHWAEAIDHALAEAQIVLLLISPDFMNSDYCFGKEMQEALAREQRKEAVVVPVLMRPCDWESAPFAKSNVVPSDNRPVSTHPGGEDEALALVAGELRRLAKKLGNKLQPIDALPRDGSSEIRSVLDQSWVQPRPLPWRRWLSLAGGMVLGTGLLFELSRLQAREGLTMLRLGAYPEARAAFRWARWNPLHRYARCGAAAAEIGDQITTDGAQAPGLSQQINALPTTGPCGAQRHLLEGDLLFERWMANKNPADWEASRKGYETAIALDGELAEAEQRIGSLADAQNDLETAVSFFDRAKDLASGQSQALSARYRNGLAKVLLQGDDAQWLRGMEYLDGDRGNPASDVEAAMQHWRKPADRRNLGLALERLPASPPAPLQGEGVGQKWGFKLSSGSLVLVNTRSDQRCLMTQARAVTLHLAGKAVEASRALENGGSDCSTSEETIRQLMCDRLANAERHGNSAAKSTRSWLGC
ncbi:MAG: TIR domain-containing protein [Cyanobium sp.]